MRQVMFRRLVLRGFGCYRREKVLELREGLNVYIAHNEEGKSTLAAGLLAVLFGLPGSSDPSKFGKARYLNWDGVQEFSGELEFTVDRTTYRITRDFATDRVSLMCLENNAWLELAGGEHRSRARRPNVSYAEALAGLIGVSSAELFHATFFLAQPLPRVTSVDTDIVRLLTGASGSYRTALDYLAAVLKQLTKQTRDLGVTPGNQRQDRRLEQITGEIYRLESSLEEHRRFLDDLPAVRQELAELVLKHQGLSSRLGTRDEALRLWGEWRNHRQRYQALLGEQDRLQQALLRAGELNGQEEALHGEIDAAYPELVDSPPNLRASMSSLKELKNKIYERENMVSDLQIIMEQYRVEKDILQTRLEDQFSSINGRNDLLKKHGELLLLLRQQEQLEIKLSRALESAKQAAAKTGGLRPWGSLGTSPTAVLPLRQRAMTDLVHEWKEHQAYREDLDSLQDELVNKLSWFEKASPEARQACRDYTLLKERLIRERGHAAEALERRQAIVQDYLKEEKAFQQEYGSLATVGETGTGAMEDKLSLLARKKRILEDSKSAADARNNTPLIRRPVTWIGAGVIIVLALFNWPLAMVAAALAGIWLALGTRRHTRDNRVNAVLAEDLQLVEHSLDELDRRHPFLAGWGEQDLIRGQERWRLCQRQKEILAARQGELPTSEELDRLGSLLSVAREAEERFHSLTGDACRLYPDVVEAYARWQVVRQKANEITKTLDGWMEKEFGSLIPTVEDCPLNQAGERWLEAAELAAVSGASCRTVGELAAWITDRDNKWWQEALEEAQEWEIAQVDLKRARETEEEISGSGDREKSPLSMLEVAIEAIRRDIAPFDESTGHAALESQVEECGLIRSELIRLGALTGTEGNRLENMLVELGEWQLLKKEAEISLATVLAAADGDPGLALERWEDCCRRKEEADRLAGNLRALLIAHGASNIEELRLAALDLQNRVGGVLARWEKLVADYPGLPETKLEENIEDVYNSLRAEVDGLAREVEETKLTMDRLRTRQAELQGTMPLNLAEAGERLDELRKEKQRVELEVEALVLAHHELQEAAQEFQSSHRERLAQRTTGYFNRFSGVAGRRVIIDEDLHISLALEAGQHAVLPQLSQGAQDQLYLALRLAVADLLSGNLILPFIFDDPFLNFDEQRLAHAGRTIGQLGSERQVLLLSHRQEFTQWSSQLA
ncbi:MAG: AAA family ATPase [Bacillota bacterium]